MRYLSFLTLLGLLSCAIAPVPPGRGDGVNAGASGSGEYQPSSSCVNCHKHQYEQYLESGHASSFTNPVFQAQYFGEVLSRVQEDPAFSGEASLCIACHAPVTFRATGSMVRTRKEVAEEDSGVTCDFCHTLAGYEGPRPGNGNYDCRPGPRKLGPFRKSGDWHHVYSEFVTRSEFCAVCHQASNRFGLVIKDTYREWRNSSFSKRRIQCQTCHMSLHGFLQAGKPVYESGTAARETLTELPERSRLYSHRFPGAHTESQIEGALALETRLIGNTLIRGRTAAFIVAVDNERTGHKMPTGSAELRALCLEVSLSSSNGWSMNVPANSRTERAEAFDILGGGPYDTEEVSSGRLPAGSRVYRAILADAQGNPTLDSYDAERVLFDNRLQAGERRLENYSVEIPQVLAADTVKLSAVLYYIPYPGRFAVMHRTLDPEPVLVTRFEQELGVQ